MTTGAFRRMSGGQSKSAARTPLARRAGGWWLPIIVVLALIGMSVAFLSSAQKAGAVGVTPPGSYLYTDGRATAFGPESILQFDRSTGSLVSSIPMPGGEALQQLVASPDGRRLYAMYDGGGNKLVVVVDTARAAVVKLITPGFDVFDMAISPNGSKLYLVGDTATTSILQSYNLDGNNSTYTGTTVINTASPAETVGRGVSVSPDGSRIYTSLLDITGGSRNRLTTIDASTSTVLRDTTLPNGFAGRSAVSPDGGHIYVPVATTGATSRLVSVLANTGAIDGNITVDEDAYDVVVTSTKAYVITQDHGISTVTLQPLAKTGTLLYGSGASVLSPDGTRVYVTPRPFDNVTAGQIRTLDTANDQTTSPSFAQAYGQVSAIALANVPASTSAAYSGSPQAVGFGNDLPQPLVAVVKDSAGDPIAAKTVTFALPPGLTFPGGSDQASTVTDSSGLATSPTIHVNNPGDFSATAHVDGIPNDAQFLLKGLQVASISPFIGSVNQSAQIGTAFPNALSVTLRDSQGGFMPGRPVRFDAPVTATGPSGTFAGGLTTVTVNTNSSGNAIPPTFTANNVAGTYQVTAQYLGGLATTFTLTNTPGPAASLSLEPAGASPQSAVVKTGFATPLSARVYDGFHNPVQGATVTFTAPDPVSGPTGSFPGGNGQTGTAVSDVNGYATAPPFTAGDRAGSYQVTATAPGASSVSYSLTNTAGAPSAMSPLPDSSPQLTRVFTAFPNLPAVKVLDDSGNLVPNAPVTFTVPATVPGAGPPSGFFPGGVTTATATTNGDGVATGPQLTANGFNGDFDVSATTPSGGGTVGTTLKMTNGRDPVFTSPVGGGITLTTGQQVNSIPIHVADIPPSASLTMSGALPNGLTYQPAGSRDATISGQVAADAGGTYVLDFAATNVFSTTHLVYTITVNQLPAFTSAADATFTTTASNTFSVKANGYPRPTLSLAPQPGDTPLPAGVVFLPGSGTDSDSGVLTGSAPAGTYHLTFKASNAAGDVLQPFTLTVHQAPAFTSADTTAFTTGSAGNTFTVTTSGSPAAALSLVSSKPAWLTFTPGPNGTAVLTGNPTEAGSFPLKFQATNADGTATQDFTLTASRPAAITSANNTAFATGAAGSFTVATTGSPTPAIAITPQPGDDTLPASLTFTDNNNGTATLAGAPSAGGAGDGGVYHITISATSAGPGVPTTTATQSFTLTINQPPAITSTNSTTFTSETANSFAVTTTGYPKPTVTAAGLPANTTLVQGSDGNYILGGNPAPGVHTFTLTAHNGSGDSPAQTFTLTDTKNPAITSPDNVTFTAQIENTQFTVATTGYPTPALSITGTLPLGVTFTDNGNGTATLAGNPSTTSTSTITITASNGSVDATQVFTLRVTQAPSFTSPTSTTFTTSGNNSFTFQTAGGPNNVLTQTGTLPPNVTFADNGNGTATLTGTPPTSATGNYPLNIRAANIAGFATQDFTLTVSEGAAFLSDDHITFTTSANNSFVVQASGSPTPTLSQGGDTLPAGLTFTDRHDGSAILSGTPASTGTFNLTFTAHNSLGDTVQNFILTVTQAPAITSDDHTTFSAGAPGTFTVTTAGSPTASLSLGGDTLPAGVTFTDNTDGTATLAGTTSATGVYNLTITAHSTAGDTVQNFALTINATPVITSLDATTFSAGAAGTFTVTTAGSPTPTLLQTGALPAGVTFTDNTDGTATLAGTPASGSAGTYPLTLTARNSAGSSDQPFTLTITQKPVFASDAGTTFTTGAPGTFTIVTNGSPTPALTETGALPAGVTFTDNTDGTATLAGTPTGDIQSTTLFPLIVTATSPAGTTTQNFTLTQLPSLKITTTTAPEATAGTTYSTTLAAVGGTPPLTWRLTSGTLPAGLALDPSSGTISGTPSAAGSSDLTLTATDSGTPAQTATQTLALSVKAAATPTPTPTPIPTDNPTGGTNTNTDTSTGSPVAVTSSSATPASTPASTTAPTASSTSSTPTTAGELAKTGTIIASVLLIAIGLLLTGTALYRRTRR
ncbi:putative Ig domain-containing protein (plasmid) [Kitasatospora sp. NBC_00070]|uniref:putative Ig domain-containing protein n=1 Tax=Kitasatospora sp. NBC_00070 TaxID=2975962 RepID=UPI002F919F59